MPCTQSLMWSDDSAVKVHRLARCSLGETGRTSVHVPCRLCSGSPQKFATPTAKFSPDGHWLAYSSNEIRQTGSLCYAFSWRLWQVADFQCWRSTAFVALRKFPTRLYQESGREPPLNLQLRLGHHHVRQESCAIDALFTDQQGNYFSSVASLTILAAAWLASSCMWTSAK